MPLVSVVMAVRNVERFVREAVQSALGQTLSDFEVIVVDDGSSDGTAEVIRGIGDSRLHLTVLPHRGAPAALNHGVGISGGRYIAFLDGDDLWAASKLDEHVRFMESNASVDLTFSQSRLLTENGAPMRLTTRVTRGAVTFERLFVDNVIANGSSVVVRRDALAQAGTFDTALSGAYDFDVWLRVALLRPANIFCLPRVLTFYRRREGQITKDWRLMERALLNVFGEYMRAMPDRVRPLKALALCNVRRYLAAVAYETGDFHAAARLLGRSFLESPVNFVLNPRSYVVGVPLACALVFPGTARRGLKRLSRRNASL